MPNNSIKIEHTVFDEITPDEIVPFYDETEVITHYKITETLS